VNKLLVASLGVLAGSAVFLFRMRSARAGIGPIRGASPRPDQSTFIRPDLIPAAEAAARKHGVPVEGFVRQIWQESRFNPQAGSGAGAMGIAQFMAPTAAQYGIDPWEPIQALDASAKMMKALHNQFDSWALASAAYNWGSGNVRKWQRAERSPPKETRDYVALLAPLYGDHDPFVA